MAKFFLIQNVGADLEDYLITELMNVNGSDILAGPMLCTFAGLTLRKIIQNRCFLRPAFVQNLRFLPFTVKYGSQKTLTLAFL